jgi:hypothetical protein
VNGEKGDSTLRDGTTSTSREFFFRSSSTREVVVPLSDSYRAELTRLGTAAATLHKELAKAEEDAGRARTEEARKRKSAAETKSLSMIQSYLRAAESENKKVITAEKKIADLRGKLAQNTVSQNSKMKSLASAEKNERAALDRLEQQRRQREKAAGDANEREATRRRQKEKDHARELGRLASATVRHVYVREPEPEKLRVLYLTASPPGGDTLRIDAEVNNVLGALRGAKYRDLIEIWPIPAASPQDLINGINDRRPHIVHFSGHGSSHGLFLDNASFDAPEGKILGFDVLAKLISATDEPPALVVLNACYSLDGADLLLEAAPVIIAMADAINDTAAGVFATQFYAAIASAQPVGAALRQGQAMMEAALMVDSGVVQHVARDDVDIDTLRLVQPVK